MSSAQQLRGVPLPNSLFTGNINGALRTYNVEEIAQYIRSSENFDEFILNCPPVNEELGRHISDAIVQNAYIETLRFQTSSLAIRDLVAWIESRNTLVNMTSLETVVVIVHNDNDMLDCSALFRLLLTSMSLRQFQISFGPTVGCTDDVMSALSSYLSAASLREFRFGIRRLSEATFAALCNGVALSTVRKLTLWQHYCLQEFNLETVAESLAQMIVESSLEEVGIKGYGIRAVHME